MWQAGDSQRPRGAEVIFRGALEGLRYAEWVDGHADVSVVPNAILIENGFGL